MKQPLKEFFVFSKAERRGVFFLLLLIFMLLAYDIFGPIDMEFVSQDTQFKIEIEKFLASEKKEEKEQSYFSKKEKIKPIRKKQRKINPHPFDPNMMSHKQWLALGLSDRQARTIEKYKSKGGTFYKVEDFKKIYCISEDEYEQLAPYIIITNFEEDNEDSQEINIQLNLNEVNKDEIQCVKGIGPAYAKRIIKYRDLLGGYTNVAQLKEVYGMDSIRFYQISPYFNVSTDSIRKLSLSNTSYSQLLRHPYISKNLAYEITNYRKMHGNFSKVEDLNKISIVTDSLYQKIYLYFAP